MVDALPTSPARLCGAADARPASARSATLMEEVFIFNCSDCEWSECGKWLDRDWWSTRTFYTHTDSFDLPLTPRSIL